MEVRSTACSGRRTSNDVAATEADYIQITLPLEGTERVWLEQPHLLTPGSIMFGQHDRPMRFDFVGTVTKRTVLIPRTAIEEVAGRTWSMPKSIQSAEMSSFRLLTAYISSLIDLPGALPPAMGVTARNALLELVVGAVRGQTAIGSSGTLAALRVSVEAWIDRRLSANPAEPLVLGEAARDHNVSARTIHRAFSHDEGTFGEVVRRQRMNRARRELSSPAVTVQAIAARWGYADTSHFCRVFKSRYGVTPSEFRASLQVQPSAAGLPTELAGTP
jgi:AraC-like DNA-binding protein